MLQECRRTQLINKRWMESLARRSTRGFLEIGHFVADDTFTPSPGNVRVHKSQCPRKRASCHCRDILAISLGTVRRGIKRCANTLTLLRTPGITSPPPFANDSNAPRTTSSGDW